MTVVRGVPSSSRLVPVLAVPHAIDASPVRPTPAAVDGLALARRYGATGEAAMLEAWEAFVLGQCRVIATGTSPGVSDAARAEAWVLGWQAAAAHREFSGFRAGFADAVLRQLSTDLDHLEQHRATRGHRRAGELYAHFVVSLALGRRAAAEGDLDLMAEFADAEIGEDGVHAEHAGEHQLAVLRCLIGAVANANMTGMAVPRRLQSATGRACTFALHLHRPDGTVPAISDAHEHDGRELLAIAALLLGRGDLEWVATQGRAGRAPGATTATFPTGGYLVWRSGWGTDRPFERERWGLFDIGSVLDPDVSHHDQLGLTLADGVDALVVDPGHVQDGPPAVTSWFRSAAAHNVVTIDALDRAGPRPHPRFTTTPAAALIYHTTIDGLDLAIGEVDHRRLGVVHTRAVAFVGGEYWLVHDRLRAITPHRYEVRWHLPPSATSSTVVRTLGDQVVTWSPTARLSSPAWCGPVHVEDGWVARPDGTAEPAPVVVTVVNDAADADIVTVINGVDIDVFRVQAIVDAEAVIIVVERAEGTDRFGWAPGGPAWFESTSTRRRPSPKGRRHHGSKPS